MRPWVIISAGLIGGVAAVAAVCWPELAVAAPDETAPLLWDRLPALVTAFLAVYALIALALSTGFVIAAVISLRRRLAPMLAYRGPQRPDWLAPFEMTGMRRLLPALAAGQGPLARPASASWLQRPVDPATTRGEAARLHYLGLARSHFLTALILMTAIVALGLAQDYARFALLPQTVPTAAAVLIVVGLVLLAALSRLALDAAVEPLIETMAEIPVERLETGLLRRAVELLEEWEPVAKPVGEATPTPAVEIPDRFLGVFEAGQRAIVDAAERVTTTSGAVAAAARSSAETVETALREMASRIEATAEAGRADGAELAQLRGAVEALTDLLERLSSGRADADQGTALTADPAPRQVMAAPQLARELRQLLAEIDATP